MKELRWLWVPTIYHNDVIFGEANSVLDGLVEPCIKALMVLLIGYPKSTLAFSYPDMTLIRQNVRLKAVPVPVLSDLIDGSEDPRKVMVLPMLIVEVNRREAYNCPSDMGVDP